MRGVRRGATYACGPRLRGGSTVALFAQPEQGTRFYMVQPAFRGSMAFAVRQGKYLARYFWQCGQNTVARPATLISSSMRPQARQA